VRWPAPALGLGLAVRGAGPVRWPAPALDLGLAVRVWAPWAGERGGACIMRATPVGDGLDGDAAALGLAGEAGGLRPGACQPAMSGATIS